MEVYGGSSRFMKVAGELMEIHGPLFISIKDREDSWRLMETHGDPWRSMETPGRSMEIHGYSWTGDSWTSMEIHGDSMDFHEDS